MLERTTPPDGPSAGDQLITVQVEMESFPWSMPPSADGSVPTLCVFLTGVLAVTIALFVRHETATGGSDWVFRKSDAHRSINV